MKKMIIALMILGFASTGAIAQNKTCHASAKKAKPVKVAHLHRRPANNTRLVSKYQVCRDHGGYYTCCLYKNTSTTTSTPWQNVGE